MIKNTVINAELGYALATARHKDAIVICDANMPIPDGCNVIDVSLIRGVPTLEQTICAIMNDLQLPGGTISQDRLTETMQKAKVVVRTGDFGSCCTMVLYSASGMDKYVKQYDCSFSLEK